jgi:hypothetical protein
MCGPIWAELVSKTYVFVPDQSTVVQTGGIADINETHTISGMFWLHVDFDANTASFDQVDANLSESIYLPTQSLGELFEMYDLNSTEVNETAIKFEDDNPPLGGVEINITVTFMVDSLHLTGSRVDPWPDGFTYDLDAVAVRQPVIYYVDGVNGDDNNDGLSPETAFATIQKGIDTAQDGNTVLVLPGLYLDPDPEVWESIDFLGKNITLTGSDPADPNTVKNTVIAGSVLFNGTEDANCTLTGFSIRDLGNGAIYGNHTHATISYCILSGNGPCGATVIENCDGTISNCLITDNITIYLCGVNPVILGCHGLIKNCTIANNVSGVGVLDGGTTTMQNCIIYYNGDPNELEAQLMVGSEGTLNISYCDVQGGLEGIYNIGDLNWGLGNIDVDPCFFRLGYWDYEPWPCELTEGDYHLKSQGWRWSEHAVHDSHWFYDSVTSRCIDAGNPGSPLRDELLTVLPEDPNNDWGINLRINMGAYGGTAIASMPSHGWALLPDLTNDGIVDWRDLGGQVEDWLSNGDEWPGDLDRNGIVNSVDYGLLAQDWRVKTTWYEPYIVLKIYSDGWGTLLDTIIMGQEGEITISIEEENPYYDPPLYYIYAFREGHYTELYNCEKGETINVDLDPIVPGMANGVIFMTQQWYFDSYLSLTDVTVREGDTVVAQFQTDDQGRFAIDLGPGNYYFEFTFEFEVYFEEVEIQGQYQDFYFPASMVVWKPNIYLYPEETIELDVEILFPHGGQITTAIPDYSDGWHVSVEPSGVIDGQYEYLFYESSQPDYGQYDTGWVVAREGLEDFFSNNMAQTGFNQKEIDDFVDYWIPILTYYPYYAIYPQYNDELDQMIQLEFSTQPQSLIRLIYSVRGLADNNFSLQEPVIPPFAREDFTVAEWGVILK